jgi:hypothetical protein
MLIPSPPGDRAQATVLARGSPIADGHWQRVPRIDRAWTHQIGFFYSPLVFLSPTIARAVSKHNSKHCQFSAWAETLRGASGGWFVHFGGAVFHSIRTPWSAGGVAGAGGWQKLQKIDTTYRCVLTPSLEPLICLYECWASIYPNCLFLTVHGKQRPIAGSHPKAAAVGMRDGKKTAR